MKRWDCIHKRFPGNKEITGVEVGVFKGKMSKALLNIMPGLYLVMVDRWQAYSDTEKKGDPSAIMTKYDSEFWDLVFKKVKSQMRHYKGRYKIIRADSKTAAKKIKDKSCDFIFIDGDHSYEGVKADITAWLPKVKKGGYLCGHDITRVGVKQAVRELLGEIEIDDNKTWFKKI